MNWIIENKEWIFSGIGVFILGILWRVLFYKNSKKTIQKQKSGDNSVNIQIGNNSRLINKK